MHHSADRQLLLGILALQNNMIDRGVLIAAFDVWVTDKSRSLGAILLERKALQADTLSMLEALAAHHLKVHDDDPRQSLAALRNVGSARQDLEDISDSVLQDSVLHLSRDDTSAYDPFATVGTVTSSGSRFHILRPHARGGLGAVFVARDEELHREVALKQILDKHADNGESRSRFLLEAEITGGLEHPGIVPVYGLGQYADGRPYYAMRFIRGFSLKDAIDTYHAAAGSPTPAGSSRTDNRSTGILEFRQLLGRFVGVCNAMQYAHDRGVLHRDLKPGNIMLGKYGETLVVDWGLAKPLGVRPSATASSGGAPLADAGSMHREPPLQPKSASAGAETLDGSAIGTPAYMSPEQAAGRLDLLCPASDVYSLGATLYSLLTGRDAFEKLGVPETLQKVQAGDFPPPRRVKLDVPPDLEAICLKAMSLHPTERYQSPKMLADDLEHWLADEPVSARAEPWRAKARRWMGRHRTLMSGAVAALLAGSVSLLISTVLLREERDKVQRGNEQLTLERNKARRAEQELAWLATRTLNGSAKPKIDKAELDNNEIAAFSELRKVAFASLANPVFIEIRSVRPEESAENPRPTWTNSYGLKKRDFEFFQTIPTVIAVVPMRIDHADLRYLDRKFSARIVGTIDTYAMMHHIEIDAGRFLDGNDEQDENLDTIVLGANVASTLFPFEKAVGQNVVLNSVTYRVVGVLREHVPDKIAGGAGDINNDAYVALRNIGATTVVRGIKRSAERVEFHQIGLLVDSSELAGTRETVEGHLQKTHSKHDWELSVKVP